MTTRPATAARRRQRLAPAALVNAAIALAVVGSAGAAPGRLSRPASGRPVRPASGRLSRPSLERVRPARVRPGLRPGRWRLQTASRREALREARVRGQTAGSIDRILARRVSLRDLAVSFPEVEGNQLDLLVDGKRAWPRVFRDIEKARSDIHISMFGMQGDDFGWEMAHLLARKVREDKVNVVIVADKHGARMSRLTNRADRERAQELFDFYRQNGIQVVFYSRTASMLRRPSLAAFKGIYRFDHRKLIAIDGKVGYIGGLTLETASARDKHDFMMRMAGPVVHQVQASILLGYRYNGGTLEALGVTDKRSLMERFFPEPPRGPPGSRGRSSRRAGRKRGGARIVSNIPGVSQALTENTLEQIRRADRFLYVVQPYITDRRVIEELIRAKQRGVDVKVVLPSNPKDGGVVNMMVPRTIDRLVRAGVEVLRYHGPQDLGWVHGKLFLTESMLSVGSLNGDAGSLRRNMESNVVTTDTQAIRRVKHALVTRTFAECDLATRPSLWNRVLDGAKNAAFRAIDWTQY